MMRVHFSLCLLLATQTCQVWGAGGTFLVAPNQRDDPMCGIECGSTTVGGCTSQVYGVFIPIFKKKNMVKQTRYGCCDRTCQYGSWFVHWSSDRKIDESESDWTVCYTCRVPGFEGVCPCACERYTGYLPPNKHRRRLYYKFDLDQRVANTNEDWVPSGQFRNYPEGFCCNDIDRAWMAPYFFTSETTSMQMGWPWKKGQWGYNPGCGNAKNMAKIPKIAVLMANAPGGPYYNCEKVSDCPNVAFTKECKQDPAGCSPFDSWHDKAPF